MPLRCAFLVLLSCLSLAAPALAEGETDAPALPAFKATTLGGETLDSAKLYGTKQLLISFWATWCGPCIAEAPVLQELYEDYGDQVQFIVFSVDEKDARKAVDKFLKDHKLTYPVVHDFDMTTATAFGAEFLPTLILVDAEGKLAAREEGWTGEEHLKQTFKAAFTLTEPAPEAGE